MPSSAQIIKRKESYSIGFAANIFSKMLHSRYSRSASGRTIRETICTSVLARLGLLRICSGMSDACGGLMPFVCFCWFMCVRVRVHACARVCAWVSLCAGARACECVRVCVCMYACASMWVRVCVCVSVCAWAGMCACVHARRCAHACSPVVFVRVRARACVCVRARAHFVYGRVCACT